MWLVSFDAKCSGRILRRSVAASVVTALAGCSFSVGDTRSVGPSVGVTVKASTSEISKEKLESRSSEILAKEVGVTPDSVVCDGPLKAEIGRSQRCVINKGGGSIGMTATITNVQGDEAKWDVKVDDIPAGK
ncbi:DUF4333 domain-containing protein [Nocardiopsis tropica]